MNDELSSQPDRLTSKVVRKRILLAEDESGVREALALLLGLDEHEITQATNGKEALALFQQQRFDLVITDFAMPWMKGDELAGAIKHLSPSQPIILITAYAEMLAVCGNLRCVDAVLSKPFMLEQLRRTISAVLSPGSGSDSSLRAA